MNFRVFKVTEDQKQTLEYQLIIKDEDIRPGTSAADIAAKYFLDHTPHKTVDSGLSPLQDSDGIHLTKWLVLDDGPDIYWVLPRGRMQRKPVPIEVQI